MFPHTSFKSVKVKGSCHPADESLETITRLIVQELMRCNRPLLPNDRVKLEITLAIRIVLGHVYVAKPV